MIKILLSLVFLLFVAAESKDGIDQLDRKRIVNGKIQTVDISPQSNPNQNDADPLIKGGNSENQTNLNFYTDITNFIKPQIYPNSTFQFSMITGYIPVGKNVYNNSNSSIFFTLFTKINETIDNFNYTETPLIFWFDGGPGCSSQYDFWGSVGALNYDVQSKKILERNITWNRVAMMVFIDQPLGTSFAYSDYPGVNVSTTEQAGKMIMEFFTGFYNLYPNMTNLPTYIFGESYAGHYVPYFAEQFHRNNIWMVPFKGIGVGDGWIDPKTQLQSYAQNYFQVGIVSGGTYRNILGQQLAALQAYNQNNIWLASYITDQITNDTGGEGTLGAYGGVSSYDFQVYGEYGNNNTDYLFNQLPGFREGYGIPSFIPPFEDCNDTVYEDFIRDIGVSFKPSLEYLLNQSNFNVLLYNGNLDLICSATQVQDVINSLSWQNITKWKQNTKHVWSIDKKVVGTFKNFDKLTFSVVYDAGHLVPEDQPAAAYDMILRYLNWNWTASN